jgi:signal transduction histidine kinase
MPYQPIKMDISETASNTINLLMGNCIKKNITMINQINTNTFVYADTNMIQSVVQNLVSNAIKFTTAGGQITVSSENKGTMIEIAVADTGVGMKDEDLEKIFRIDAHHTTLGTAQEKGTGLGLLLCKDLIERHSGSIWVESIYGKGTTFRLTIPLYAEQDKAE